jgi:hypothetical protein
MEKQEEIEKAKQTLAKYGYYTKSLWVTYDVQMNFWCNNKQALEVLDKVLCSEAVVEYIFDSIKLQAEKMNLKPVEDE